MGLVLIVALLLGFCLVAMQLDHKNKMEVRKIENEEKNTGDLVQEIKNLKAQNDALNQRLSNLELITHEKGFFSEDQKIELDKIILDNE